MRPAQYGTSWNPSGRSGGGARRCVVIILPRPSPRSPPPALSPARIPEKRKQCRRLTSGVSPPTPPKPVPGNDRVVTSPAWRGWRVSFCVVLCHPVSSCVIQCRPLSSSCVALRHRVSSCVTCVVSCRHLPSCATLCRLVRSYAILYRLMSTCVLLNRRYIT